MISILRIIIYTTVVFGALFIPCISSQTTYVPSRTKFDSHIMSQKTWGNIQKSPDLPGALNNWGNWAQARQPAFVPPSTRSPIFTTRKPPPKINEKPLHTLIIGNRKDVSNSLLNGQKLITQKPYGPNNYFESNNPFRQIKVERNPNTFGVNKVTDMGSRLFGGAVVNNKPVHFEANYLGGQQGRPTSGFNNNQGRNSAVTGKVLYSTARPTVKVTPKSTFKGGRGRKG